MVAILVTCEESCELVAHRGDGWCADAHLPAPLHRVPVHTRLSLVWSSRHFHHTKVNEFASRAAGQLVKGDAYLVGQDAHVTDLPHLLTSASKLQPIHRALRSRMPSWPHQPWDGGHAAAHRSSTQLSHNLRPYSRPGSPAPPPPSGVSQPPVAATLLPPPPWQDLQAGLLAQVALHQPSSCSAILPLLQVCRSWRQALLNDDRVLRHVWFSINPFVPLRQGPAQAQGGADRPCAASRARRLLPLRGQRSGGWHEPPSGPASAEGCRAGESAEPMWTDAALQHHVHPAAPPASVVDPSASHQQAEQARQLLRGALRGLPRLFLAACNCSNASALGCQAQLLEVAGREDEAMRVWRRCAKVGDVEAMLRVGMACYSGAPGCPLDPEAASSWLGKGLRAILGVSHLPQLAVDLGAATLRVPWAPPPPALCQEPSEPDAASGSSARVAAGGCRPGAVAARRRAAAGERRAAASSAAPPVVAVTLTLDGLWALRARQATDAEGALSAGPTPGSGSSWGVPSRVPTITYADPHLAAWVMRAAVMLGYTYFDGDAGLPSDRALACSLFKLAVLCGSREAARCLHWMYGTGQF